MKVTMQLEGDKALKKEIARLEKLYPDAFGTALYQEGMGIWRNAVKKAPVEFGVLRTSGYVGPPTKSKNDIVVEAGFGTKYAVYQHEKENLRHPRGGEAKYLQKAAQEAQSGFLERLAQRTQKNVEAGVRTPTIGAPTAPRVSGSSGGRSRLGRIRRRR